MKENLKIEGYVRVKCFEANGTIRECEGKNLVLDGGRSFLLRSLFDIGGASANFYRCVKISIGDGAFASYDVQGDPVGNPIFPIGSDTSLGNEIDRREVLEYGQPSKNLESFEVSITTTFYSFEIGQNVWMANNTGFLINEVSLIGYDPVPSSEICISKMNINNFPFNPASPSALSVEWVLRIP